MVTLLLTTKLHIPPQRRNLVPRRRLLERLNQGLHRKLTMVSAPAGFGKTTLLGEWIQSLEASDSPSVKVIWLSLDSGDDDPARFFAYLAAAFQGADESISLADPDALRLARAFPLESHLVNLINLVAVLPQAFVLVLDDYHLVTSQAIHDSVTFLVDHLSENLHVIIATRADPPLPLARLRARGQLTELRQTDLRFTAEEAATFLNDIAGLNLSPEDVAALEARTEGWIAGLQMASLAMRGIAARGRQHAQGIRSPAGFIQTFTGSHRFILDYLMEEVLDQQPPAIQEFLLKTSILERLTGPLCDTLLETGDRRLEDEPAHPPYPISTIQPPSQQFLEHLEAANLFIVPLDDERRWYRYHRLFSDLLRKRLRQTYRDLVPALHRRASEWHDQQGLTAVAIDHALAAKDLERAVHLIEESVEETFMRSEVVTFLHWMEKLPADLVRTRPTLCFFHAWALLMSGRSLDAVEQHIQDIVSLQDAAASTGIMPGRLAALRAYSVLFQADMQRAAELCREALEHLPESDLFLRSIMTWILSLARLTDGDLEDSSQALEEVARMGQEIGNPLIAVTALCHQARLQKRRGRLHRAREILERALQLATDRQGRRLPVASEALIGLGELEREWNNLESAADYLTESIELAKQWSELASFDAYSPLARTRLAQGNAEGAREAIEAARQIAHRSEATQIDDLVADLQQAYFAVTEGDIAGTIHWAEKRALVHGATPEPHPGLDEGQDLVSAHLRKYEHLVLARLFILQGRATEALDLLEALLAQATKLGRIDLTIDIQILRALAYQVEGHDTQAIDALAEALSLAEPGGHMRTFLDEGQSMARLLRQAASRGIAPAYVANLLAAFDVPAPEETVAQPLIEPLSERELEVLRLLATGLSNPEIAEQLYIAVSTVRSHCKSIYGKLNVHKRWDAVQRAQELGLL